MINGIKPKITTTTKLGIKPTSFESAMEEFCRKLTENVKPEVDRFNHMHSVTFSEGGVRKYIRVESFQTNWLTEYNDDGTLKKEVTPDGSKKRARLHLGFKAQDVLAVEQADGYAGKKDDMLLINLNEDDTAYGMKYERLVVVLTKAVQELSTKNDALEARIATLEAA